MTESAPFSGTLSVIVPVLNERDELPGFLDNLADQQEVDFELLICDGGSTDGSVEWLEEMGQTRVNLRVVSSPPGRARQLNRGIEVADGEWLLLLHVDSRFRDPCALSKAVAQLSGLPSRTVAGHFALTFRRTDSSAEFAYYFYEWKARLGFEETIHGDQGFLLHRRLFGQVGLFDESLPAMEDTDFADRLRRVGQWQLLASEISTSARRFEQEGLWQRQLLGALIMCFRSVGWKGFFAAAPAVYRRQNQTDQLKISPFFELIRELLAEMSVAQRRRLWHQCGCYVRRHGWQLFVALDARRAWRKGMIVGQGRLWWTVNIVPLYNLATDHIFGRFAAAVVLRVWFEMMAPWLKKKEKI